MEKINSTQISRVMWCEKCAKNKQPRIDSVLLLQNFDRQFQTLNQVVQKPKQPKAAQSPFGFTPHLIINPHRVNTLDGKKMCFFKCCGVVGCGVRLEVDNSSVAYYLDGMLPDNLPIQDFLALINYTRDPQYFLETKYFQTEES